jgi:toll-interacting protein
MSTPPSNGTSSSNSPEIDNIQQNQNDQQQHQQLVNADNFKVIKEMFPTFEDDIIKSILQANNGNKDQTIESLLQMTAS